MRRFSKKFFRYENEKGLHEITPEQAKGTKHYVVFTDTETRETRREDYCEDGRLRNVTISRFNDDGRVAHQDFYSTKLNFFRERDGSGTLKEFNPDGGLIRALDED